jgi:hypothetical protein
MLKRPIEIEGASDGDFGGISSQVPLIFASNF